jgi:DNA-binding transcriptional regulator YbjK
MQLTDAAIVVLGTHGMRQLTHRAVDAAAGVPIGSTSNRFRTREALLVGVLGRILERETAIWAGLVNHVHPASVDVFAEVAGRLLEELTGPERLLSQARRTVFVEAVNQPVLRDAIVRGQQELIAWLGPLLAALGSADPARDVHHLLALMDGLIGLQLVNPVPSFDPSAAIAGLLRGLIDA